MEKMRSATVQNAQPQKSFLLRTDKRRERRGRCEKLGDGDRHRSRGGDSATWREVGAVLRGEDFGTMWEYQIKRAIRRN